MSAVDSQDVAERQRAAKALLLHPLLTAEGTHGPDFRLVRRHQGELTKQQQLCQGVTKHLVAPRE